MSPHCSTSSRTKPRSSDRKRSTMITLVIAEHDNSVLKPATLCTVAAAAALGGEIHVLVAGHQAASVAQTAAQIQGVSKVLHADGESLAHALAENLTAQVLAIADGYSHFLFPATRSEEHTSQRVAAKQIGRAPV